MAETIQEDYFLIGPVSHSFLWIIPMDSRTTLGFDEVGSIVQFLEVPQAKNTVKVPMGDSATNFFIPGPSAEGASIWTAHVGPCHIVLVHGLPRNPGTGFQGLGKIGLAHVSGDHDTIVRAAVDLVSEMEKTLNCEVFIVGGQPEFTEKGFTFRASEIPTSLQGKVKLVVSPASNDNGFIKIEITGARKINISPDTEEGI